MNFRFLLRLIFFGACIAVLATRAQNPPPQNKPSAAKPAVSKSSAKESAEGEKRFEAHCGRCHVPPESLSPGQARTVVRQMRVRANLTSEDQRLILKYLAP